MTFLERVRAKAAEFYGTDYGLGFFVKGATYGRTYTPDELLAVVEAIAQHDNPEMAAHFALQALEMTPL